MIPEQIAKGKNPTEYSEQCALFCWCANHIKKYPELKWFHSITNEEKTGNVLVGTRAKSSGRKKGVSDLMLPVKRGIYSGLYIEMKRRSKKPKRKTSMGGASKEQLAFGKFVQEQGFGFIVCYGWIEARDVLIQYLEQ